MCLASLAVFDSMEQNACFWSEVLGSRRYFYSDHSYIKLESTRDSMSSVGGNSIFLTFVFSKIESSFCVVNQSV